MFAPSASSRPRSLKRYYLRRHYIGAIFALTGFVSQYPIPVIHRCPVMNPHGIAVIGDSESSSHDHSDHKQSASHDHQDQHASPAVPPCHGSGSGSLAVAGVQDHSLDHRAEHAETESKDEGGHSHDACPVCQGHAQLIQGLPTPALPTLTTLYQFQARVPQFVEAPLAKTILTLPPARAPPRAV